MSTYTDIFGLYAVKQEDNILFLLWDLQKAVQLQKCGPLPEEQTDVVTAAEEEVHFGEYNNRRLFLITHCCRILTQAVDLGWSLAR